MKRRERKKKKSIFKSDKDKVKEGSRRKTNGVAIMHSSLHFLRTRPKMAFCLCISKEKKNIHRA